MGISKIEDYSLSDLKDTINKVHWTVESKKAVLLIHDMQRYFTAAFQENGNLYPACVDHIRTVKEACTEKGIPVVYSAQPEGQSLKQRGLLMDFWGDGIPAGVQEHNIVDDLQPDPGDTVMTKWRYSAFENTGLEELMRKTGRDQIIVTGIYAHIGCLTTSLAAFMKGIKAFMISDATADFSLERHQYALDYVSRLSGMVLNTGQLVNGLCRELG